MLLRTWLCYAAALLLFSSTALRAQEPLPTPEDNAAPNAVPQTPVAVAPVDDRQIEARLRGIFEAIQKQTDWFESLDVHVEDGIVYLSGRTFDEQHRQWAGALAQKTEDVVAVVNRIELTKGPVWNLQPAWDELSNLWRQAVQFFPLVVVAVVILFATWLLAKGVARASGALLRWRMRNPLLRDVATKAIAIPVFLLGLYIVLRVSGLTRLAVTILGGTGLIGLVIGIAFRDIAENFLASLLISQQNPFRPGDLIEIEGQQGYAQRVTIRGTILMNLDGNYIQIPNATVYKSTIINYTANPSSRLSFTIGIGYENAVAEAQEVALAVVRDHPAVLDEPEPMVIADRLGASTIDVIVYFWIDGTVHSPLRVRSSVMRLVKRAFQEKGISLPDEAREVIFPEAVPIRQLGAEDVERAVKPSPAEVSRSVVEPETVTTNAEGDLRSEAGELETQVRRSRLPEAGGDLLAADSDAHTSGDGAARPQSAAPEK